MPRYALGTTVRVGPLLVRDSTNALIDASSTSVVLQKPDASLITYSSLTHDGTGTYHLDIPAVDLTQQGHYQWYATAIAGTFGFVLPSGAFDVFDPLEALLVPLQDAKDALNIKQSVTASDDEIMRKVSAIEAGIERITGGPIINRTITERAEIVDSYSAILLRKRPIVSVTSITALGSVTPLTVADLDIDVNASILRRKLGWPFYGPFYQWQPAVTVVYVAGWGPAVPPAIAEAATDILKHWWESQRSGVSLPRFGAEGVTQLPGMAFAIPNMALEKLALFASEVYI
jgi:hypothetical protein